MLLEESVERINCEDLASWHHPARLVMCIISEWNYLNRFQGQEKRWHFIVSLIRSTNIFTKTSWLIFEDKPWRPSSIEAILCQEECCLMRGTSEHWLRYKNSEKACNGKLLSAGSERNCAADSAVSGVYVTTLPRIPYHYILRENILVPRNLLPTA